MAQSLEPSLINAVRVMKRNIGETHPRKPSHLPLQPYFGVIGYLLESTGTIVIAPKKPLSKTRLKKVLMEEKQFASLYSCAPMFAGFLLKNITKSFRKSGSVRRW